MQTVNSYDIYDTLIARRTIEPIGIFETIEKELNFQHFSRLRRECESCCVHPTFDDIYAELQKKTDCNDITIKLLKSYELATEISHSYLIRTNYSRVSDGDILVSDMYFSQEQLEYILRCLGLNKRVVIYSSSSCKKSKHDGDMYDYLKTKYDIKKHLGDNIYADIQKAEEHGIPAELTRLSPLNKNEKFFVANGLQDFAFFIREFRHSTVYSIDSNEYALFMNQASFNLPILILECIYLHMCLQKENRNTVLFLTRDSCLLIHLFKKLYPQYNSIEYLTSRLITLKHCNEEYEAYVRNLYDDKTCMIYDGNGTFNSSKQLFLKLFDKLPRVHIFAFHNSEHLFDECTANLIDNIDGVLIECYNIDTKGSVQMLSNGTFCYTLPEHPLKVGIIYKETCEKLIEFIDSMHFNITEYISRYIPSLEEINTTINLFFKHNTNTPFIDKDQFTNLDILIQKRDR